MRLLPLDGCGGLGGDVVDDAADAGDFLDDPAGDLFEEVVGDPGGFGSHKVAGLDGPKAEDGFVDPLVMDGADGFEVGEDGEVLAEALVEAGRFDFFSPDGVCLLEGLDPFGGDGTDDPNAEAGAWEGLTPDLVMGNAQEGADGADFVFKEVAEGLHQALEANVLGQASDIVMGLDAGAADAGFEDIGIDGALDEVVDLAQLLGFFLEDPDEFLADGLALGFGVGDTGEPSKEAVASVDTNEVHAESFFVNFFDGGGLIFTHEAVVHEDAGEAVADGLVDQEGGDGRIHSAGESADGTAIADLILDLLNGQVHEVFQLPGAFHLADIEKEIFEKGLALFEMAMFWMGLNCIDLPVLIDKGGDFALVSVGNDLKARAGVGHLIVMVHINGDLFAQALVEAGFFINIKVTDSLVQILAALNLSPLHFGDPLAAVTDAEDRNAQVKNFFVHPGGIRIQGGFGASREDDAGVISGLNLLQRDGVGFNYAKDVEVTDHPADHLLVLVAKINN